MPVDPSKSHASGEKTAVMKLDVNASPQPRLWLPAGLRCLMGLFHAAISWAADVHKEMWQHRFIIKGVYSWGGMGEGGTEELRDLGRLCIIREGMIQWDSLALTWAWQHWACSLEGLERDRSLSRNTKICTSPNTFFTT